jgi:hypothetical protein
VERDLTGQSSPNAASDTQIELGLTREEFNAFQEAVAATYRWHGNELAQLSDVAIGGVPADLVGRRARAALLAELNRPSELRRETESLAGDLHSARWQLDRGAYFHYAQEVSRWLDAARRKGWR